MAHVIALRSPQSPLSLTIFVYFVTQDNVFYFAMARLDLPAFNNFVLLILSAHTGLSR